MLFNSVEFAVFLPIVFLLYWFACNRSARLQNVFLVAASCVFYAWWDWRFLILIGITTFCSWLSGLLIIKARKNNTTSTKQKERAITIANVLLNLAILLFFKYYNFFIESFIDAFTLFRCELPLQSLRIILPVGISFYTFQALSYTIDVYKKKIEPTQDIISFTAFISFFPQLAAGPIERASNLLTQFQSRRSFDYAKSVDGLRQILWGLFKKIVIADNCAEYANLFFNHSSEYGGSALLLGAFFFTFQIYGDFSGYSDIAIGTARLFGINLMRNFNFPYFSRDIAEFWRRWHISLTTWFRDYVYIPLGGSHGRRAKVVRNTFIIFLISGLWHGANWTFILWGVYHAVLFLPLLLSHRNRKHTNTVADGKRVPNIRELCQMTVTFVLVLFGWIIFRADSIGHAVSYIREIASPSLFTIPDFEEMTKAAVLILLIILFTFVEWLGRGQQYAIEKLWLKKTSLLRWAIYAFIVFLILLFMPTSGTPFIYFQF